MQSVTDRRTFVRNVVVGVPMVAGLASLSHALGATPAHDGARLEPALDSMLRDFARLHNQMRRRPVTADDIRACAAHMRSLAAYQISSNRDASLTGSARDAIDRLGPHAILSQPADLAAMRHELVAFGFDSPLVGGSAPASAEARLEMLQRVARGGLSPLFSESGEIVGDFALLGLTAGASSCETLREMHAQMEVVASVTCAIAVVFPVLAPDCFAATTVLAVLKVIMYVRGC